MPLFRHTIGVLNYWLVWQDYILVSITKRLIVIDFCAQSRTSEAKTSSEMRLSAENISFYYTAGVVYILKLSNS